MVRVKICCIASEAEARLAVAAGAAALGFVSEMPSGPGVIPEEEIAAIARTVPPGVARVLLTASRDPDHIAAQQRRCGVDTLQLVSRQAVETYPALRRKLPGVSLVQVVHVTGPEARVEAERVAPYVDALLLDTGAPDAPVPELGGTGRVHDWTISAAIREASPLPVFLAGGLDAENVETAITTVRPFAVDLCSRLRTRGVLDQAKLQAFMRAVGRASGERGPEFGA